MIPNVFVSSTIEDLHHLRDAIRETLADLGYLKSDRCVVAHAWWAILADSQCQSSQFSADFPNRPGSRQRIHLRVSSLTPIPPAVMDRAIH